MCKCTCIDTHMCTHMSVDIHVCVKDFYFWTLVTPQNTCDPDQALWVLEWTPQTACVTLAIATGDGVGPPSPC